MTVASTPTPVPAPVGIPPAPPVRPRRPLLGNRRRQVVAGAVIVIALAFLLWRGLADATVYYKTASQAVADRAQLGTTPFRIEGTVTSPVRRVGTDVAFTITADRVSVPVISTGSPPQLFRRGVPVVLAGHWQGRHFASNQIMVKHTESYVAARPKTRKSGS